MAKNKPQRAIKKELHSWYRETMTEYSLSWNEASAILVDEYRESDIKDEKEIYTLLIDINEGLLRDIRHELEDELR